MSDRIDGLIGTCTLAVVFLIGPGSGMTSPAGERTERFDRDPGWEGRNNRSNRIPARTVRQDFGFAPDTRRAGGRAAGELGGTITPAAEPAFYAKRLSPRTLRDRLTASGTIACGGGQVHALVGFFNAGTVNEWRTPNTIVVRIQGRGDRFFAYVEYATTRWRAGGDEPQPFVRVRRGEDGRLEPRGFAARGTVHTWSLAYDPDAAGGRGSITATIDGETSVCDLAPGHKADGASFDRFGVLTISKSADSPGELWLDDIDIGGDVEGFTTDPRWEGRGNRRSYETTNIRPRFDFGFSNTHFAAGAEQGELGGLIFRGDIRDPDRMAGYGDRVGPLALERPLRASGTIALRRGVSDSTTLLGFYHSVKSFAVNQSQASGWPERFLGLAIEGPSREGFYVYPVYRVTGENQAHAQGPDRSHILPDGIAHRWNLEYDPAATGGRGRITLTFDGNTTHVDLRPGDRPSDRLFDRFGIVTTWIDGNGQSIYFDDLTYTNSNEDGRH